jgi:hypothetical protein
MRWCGAWTGPALARQCAARCNALACVALPTCGLAMAEAERYLPDFVAKLDPLLEKHGLRDAPILLRISGCPNGCSRPYLGEIALVGKAPGRYNLMLGCRCARRAPQRLYRENIDEAAILAALDPLFARYAGERLANEGFGDFLVRAAIVAPFPPNAFPWSCSHESSGPGRAAEDAAALIDLNRWLERQTFATASPGRSDSGAANHALSSSFGAQSAVSLHLVTQAKPDIPVILVDTGYLFPETYRFADQLVDRLKLNLKVYRPQVGIAWMEARYGKPVGTGRGRDRSLQPPAQGRTDAARAGRTRRAHLVRRPAPRPIRVACGHARCGTEAGPLESASHRRLVRPRRVRVSQAPPSALSPALGTRLRLDRRLPHHAALATGHARGRHAFLRAQARVRDPRGRLRRMRRRDSAGSDVRALLRPPVRAATRRARRSRGD